MINTDFVSILSLSLVMPGNSADKILIAIGKGFRLLEVWTSHTSSGELQNVGLHNNHNQVVTGLLWKMMCSLLFLSSGITGQLTARWRLTHQASQANYNLFHATRSPKSEREKWVQVCPGLGWFTSQVDPTRSPQHWKPSSNWLTLLC